MTPVLHPPIRIAVVGAGHHSRAFHLPALSHFDRQHPGSVIRAALVDSNLATATAAAAEFGFEAAYASADEMLAAARPEACLVITPVELNAAIATQLARDSLPLLMEKPPGASIVEARKLVADLAAVDARVMVSMNRRFDPLLRAALDWIGPRPIRQVKATMARQARTEPKFVEHTGLHVVDAVRAIGGEVASCRPSRQNGHGGEWFQAELAFAGGVTALVDLMPRAGANSEFLKILGDDFRVEIRSAEFDRGGWRAWLGGRLEKDETLPRSTPMFFANGTFAETEAFIRALRTGRGFSPTPADVLPAMEICHQMEAARSAKLIS
ncbi:MAG TPA: Gfo/Idh/MocA family oxidoreductase [Opitutus sp.]|nr:Gfo/Idh/MocA family oxidoreductase [Opitutus sp.]